MSATGGGAAKFALLFLAAAAAFGSAVLTDDVYQLPAGEWRWVRFEIRQRPATLDCRFEVVGGGTARAELVSRADLELIRQHKHHDVLAATERLRAAALTQLIQEPGEYAVVIENGESQPVAVHLSVGLTFGSAKPISRYLSPQRRLTVILVSFATFFAIVTYSTRVLLRAIRRG
jgi:hypothetical protein